MTSSLLSIMSSATHTWASCEVIGGTRFFFTLLFTSSLGESDRGGEHPGELTKSGWIRLSDAARAPNFGTGRARPEARTVPHAMRTWAGTRLNHDSKTPGMGEIVSIGMSSFQKPSYMPKRSCDSPGPRFTLLLWYHTPSALVVGSTDIIIPRRTGRSRRRSWKATPTSKKPW